MKTEIWTIPHTQQAYDTCGDWWIDKLGNRHIRVSSLKDKDFEFLIALHELIEQHLCERHGISGETVTRFDVEHLEGEPGARLDCPYRKEHVFAENLERLMAQELGIDWSEYETAIEKL